MTNFLRNTNISQRKGHIQHERCTWYDLCPALIIAI